MNTQPSPTPDADLLIAYLDGELERVEAQRVEERLASDAEFHRLMMEHQKAWNMLESLPHWELNEDFAHSTIEMIAVRAEEEASSESKKRRGALRGLWLVACCLGMLVGFGGYAVAKYVVDAPNRTLLRQLPVIQELEAYERAENLEFLKELRGRELFQDPLQSPVASRTDAEDLGALTLAGRRDYVRDLPRSEQRSLADKAQEFASLSPARQQELLQLRERIADDPDADELRTTLLRYSWWLHMMSGEDRTALLSMQADERLDAIASRVNEEERIRIPDADWEVLQQWALEIVRRNRDDLLQLEPQLASVFRKVTDTNRQERMLIGLLMTNRETHLLLDPQSISTLKSQLSPESAQKLETSEDSIELIRIWWRRRIGAAWSRGRGSFDGIRGFRRGGSARPSPPSKR